MASKKFSSEKMERYFNDPVYRHGNIKRKKYFNRKHFIVLGGIVIFAALLTWYSVYIVNGLPTLEQLENPKPELATKIFSADGEVLDQFAYKNRTRVTLNKLPPGLIKGLIATEDKDFYNHWGVNLPRFIRQMIINIVMFRQEGASTITQQLARNLYKLQIRHETIFDKITRKIREFFTSVQIERRFTKNEILEFYLNVSYFGRPCICTPQRSNLPDGERRIVNRRDSAASPRRFFGFEIGRIRISIWHRTTLCRMDSPATSKKG